MPEQVLALICVTHDPVLFPPGPTGIAKVAKQNDPSVQSDTWTSFWSPSQKLLISLHVGT